MIGGMIEIMEVFLHKTFVSVILFLLTGQNYFAAGMFGIKMF